MFLQVGTKQTTRSATVMRKKPRIENFLWRCLFFPEKDSPTKKNYQTNELVFNLSLLLWFVTFSFSLLK